MEIEYYCDQCVFYRILILDEPCCSCKIGNTEAKEIKFQDKNDMKGEN